MKSKNLILFSILSFFIINLSATIQAPSQLEWSKTKRQMIGDGYQFENCKFLLDNAVQYCRITNIKKPISFANSYTVYFVDGYGLSKVYVIGKDITGDAYGTEGKAQYEKIKSSLVKKYPNSDGYQINSYEWGGGKLYKESDEFYECLGYEGCGSYVSFITSSSDNIERGVVSIEIQGYGRGVGSLDLIYESEFWSEALDSAREKQNQSDNDAL